MCTLKFLHHLIQIRFHVSSSHLTAPNIDIKMEAKIITLDNKNIHTAQSAHGTWNWSFRLFRLTSIKKVIWSEWLDRERAPETFINHSLVREARVSMARSHKHGWMGTVRQEEKLLFSLCVILRVAAWTNYPKKIHPNPCLKKSFSFIQKSRTRPPDIEI